MLRCRCAAPVVCESDRAVRQVQRKRAPRDAERREREQREQGARAERGHGHVKRRQRPADGRIRPAHCVRRRSAGAAARPRAAGSRRRRSGTRLASCKVRDDAGQSAGDDGPRPRRWRPRRPRDRLLRACRRGGVHDDQLDHDRHDALGRVGQGADARRPAALRGWPSAWRISRRRARPTPARRSSRRSTAPCARRRSGRALDLSHSGNIQRSSPGCVHPPPPAQGSRAIPCVRRRRSVRGCRGQLRKSPRWRPRAGGEAGEPVRLGVEHVRVDHPERGSPAASSCSDATGHRVAADEVQAAERSQRVVLPNRLRVWNSSARRKVPELVDRGHFPGETASRCSSGERRERQRAHTAVGTDLVQATAVAEATVTCPWPWAIRTTSLRTSLARAARRRARTAGDRSRRDASEESPFEDARWRARPTLSRPMRPSCA